MNEAKHATAVGVDFRILNDGTGATATLTPTNDAGVPKPMPAGASIPVWVASDPNVGVTPAADGMSANIGPKDPAKPVDLTGATATATSTLADGSTIVGTTPLFDIVVDPANVASKFQVVLS